MLSCNLAALFWMEHKITVHLTIDVLLELMKQGYVISDVLSAERKGKQSKRLEGGDSGWGIWDKMVREGILGRCCLSKEG